MYNLVNELGAMRELGVDVVRISPQSQQTGQIAALFRDVLDNRIGAQDALRQMEPLMPEQPCNGYWHGKPGLDRMVA